MTATAHNPYATSLLPLLPTPPCVQVGYKFRLFGEDAEVAARVCNM